MASHVLDTPCRKWLLILPSNYGSIDTKTVRRLSYGMSHSLLHPHKTQVVLIQILRFVEKP
jgi:hypothetical protein